MITFLYIRLKRSTQKLVEFITWATNNTSDLVFFCQTFTCIYFDSTLVQTFFISTTTNPTQCNSWRIPSKKVGLGGITCKIQSQHAAYNHSFQNTPAFSTNNTPVWKRHRFNSEIILSSYEYMILWPYFWKKSMNFHKIGKKILSVLLVSFLQNFNTNFTIKLRYLFTA